jgi:hypothetical protein
MNFLIIKFSHFSCYFLLIRPKYVPHHPILEDPQSVFPLVGLLIVSYSYKTTEL